MGSAVIYGVLATAGCLAIDTVMSGAVLLAFVAGWAIQVTDLAVYLNYLDPAMVAVLCLLSLPISLRILIENGRRCRVHRRHEVRELEILSAKCALRFSS